MLLRLFWFLFFVLEFYYCLFIYLSLFINSSSLNIIQLFPILFLLSHSLSLFLLITSSTLFAKLRHWRVSFLMTDGQRWWSDLEICRTPPLPRDVENSLGKEGKKHCAIENAESSVQIHRSLYHGLRPPTRRFMHNKRASTLRSCVDSFIYKFDFMLFFSARITLMTNLQIKSIFRMLLRVEICRDR